MRHHYYITGTTRTVIPRFGYNIISLYFGRFNIVLLITNSSVNNIKKKIKKTNEHSQYCSINITYAHANNFPSNKNRKKSKNLKKKTDEKCFSPI